jgi:hypothetical protein
MSGLRGFCVIALAGVSACTGGASGTAIATLPVTVPSSSVSTAATRPPSASTSTGAISTTNAPSVLGMPIAAQIDSPEGAVAFVRFAVSKVNEAYSVADPGVLDEVFARVDCPGCDFIKKDVGEFAKLKQRAAADLLSVTVVMPNTWEPGKATVELRVSQQRVDVLDESGRRVDFFKPGAYRYLVTLSRSTSWLIVRWQGINP